MDNGKSQTKSENTTIFIYALVVSGGKNILNIESQIKGFIE